MPISKETEATLRAERVRPDFVPASDYISPEFAQLEYERLWPKVWQLACREEEIPKVGDYVTYEIGNQSFIIVRSREGIRSFYNVCLHRGRRLTTGCGNVARFHCTYHAWQWNLDGTIATVLDRPDWNGCGSMADADLRMKQTLVDTWGGFVFINMDPNAEPLVKALHPIPEILGPYEYDKLRFRFNASFRLPCNWKVGLEAFDEGYHVAGTHPQLLQWMGDDTTRSVLHGRHSMFYNPMEKAPFGAPSPRLNKPIPADIRPGLINHFDELIRTLPVLYSVRDAQATHRLMTEAGTPKAGMEVYLKAMEFQKEAAIASGAGWPNLSPEQMAKAGIDWHIFPNMITLCYPDGVIVYRSRPDGDNPDSCIYEVWGLERYPAGAEPPIKRHVFHGKDDWRGVGPVSLILEQDFINMEQVQQGMKSYGFPGNRPSPLQEGAVYNLHRVLREEFLFGQSAAMARAVGAA
jgi:phenylpropionate dioxygenase-like ring-hydroxylating dioxygenase large terminal subunit